MNRISTAFCRIKAAKPRVEIPVAVWLMAATGMLWAQPSPQSAPTGASNTVRTEGNCNAVLQHVVVNRDFSIVCNGLTQAQFNEAIDKLLRVTGDLNDSMRRVQSQLDATQGESLQRQAVQLEAMAEQMAQLKRAELPFATTGLPVDLVLKYRLETGGLEAFGRRLAEATSRNLDVALRKKWPAGYPFGQIEWLAPDSFFYPKAADGAALTVFETPSVEMNCYTRSQREDATVAAAVNRPRTITDSVNIPVQPHFGQFLEPTLGKCGTNLAVSDAFQEGFALLRSEKLSAAPGKVVRTGNMTSVVDLFGAICHVLVRPRDISSSTPVRQSTEHARLIDLELHLPQGLKYMATDKNYKLVDAGPGYVMYVWEMPRQLRDIGIVPTANSFAPLPACRS